MIKTFCNSEDEAEVLARTTASAGYVGLDICLSQEDVRRLQAGEYIYAVCNDEYGVLVHPPQKPPAICTCDQSPCECQ